MIFVTSGSMLPFDRLFKLVDAAIESKTITEPVYGQIGESRYQPQKYPFDRFLNKEQYDENFQNASLVIAHAGIGVIMQALSMKKPLLVIARRAELGEHVNDHQVSTAKKFEELGHILAFDEDNFSERLATVRTFTPTPRNPNAQGIGQRVADYLATLVP